MLRVCVVLVVLTVSLPSPAGATPLLVQAKENLCLQKRRACEQTNAASLTDALARARAEHACFNQFYVMSEGCKFTDAELRTEALRITKQGLDNVFRRYVVLACMDAAGPSALTDDAAWSAAGARCEAQTKSTVTRDDLVRYMARHNASGPVEKARLMRKAACSGKKDGKPVPDAERFRCSRELDLWDPTGAEIAALVTAEDEDTRLRIYQSYATLLCWAANGARRLNEIPRRAREICEEEEKKGLRMTPNQLKIYDSMRDAIEGIGLENTKTSAPTCTFVPATVIERIRGRPVTPNFIPDHAACTDRETWSRFATAAGKDNIDRVTNGKRIDLDERTCRDAALKEGDIPAAHTDCRLKADAERIKTGVLPAYYNLATPADYGSYIVGKR